MAAPADSSQAKQAALAARFDPPFRPWIGGQDRIYAGPGKVPSYDWPNPPPGTVRARRFAACTAQSQANLGNNVLRGQDRIYAGPGKVPSYDWPFQRPRPQPGENRSHLADRIRSTLLGQDRIYGSPGQVPDYDYHLPRRIGPRPVTADTPNLLTTLLAALGAALDLPLLLEAAINAAQPRWLSAPRSVGLLSHIEALVLGTLQGQDQIYGAPGQSPDYDWPYRPPLRYPAENRSHLVSEVNGLLAGQGRIYGPPGQVANYDYPLPRGVGRRPASADAANLLTTVYAIVGGALDLPLLQQAAINAAQMRRLLPPRSIELLSHIETLVASTLAGQDQIHGAPGQAHAYDYPFRPPLRYPAANREHLASTVNSLLIGQDRIYGSPGMVPAGSWPNPVLRRAPRPDLTLGSNAQLLSAITALAPFVVLDWQDPRRLAPALRRLRQDHTGSTLLLFTVQTAKGLVSLAVFGVGGASVGATLVGTTAAAASAVGSAGVGTSGVGGASTGATGTGGAEVKSS